MVRHIFYVMSCDEWKSHDSERLVWIGSSDQKTKMFISRQIENGDMLYGEEEMPPKRQAKQFREDWKNKTRTYLNSNLMYGFYDYVHDNEEV